MVHDVTVCSDADTSSDIGLAQRSVDMAIGHCIWLALDMESDQNSVRKPKRYLKKHSVRRVAKRLKRLIRTIRPGGKQG